MPVKLALHRSTTFWAGLLAMGFVCWAWWDSSRASNMWGRGDWLLTHCESQVSLGHIQLGKHGWFSFADSEAASNRMQLRRPVRVRHLGGNFWNDEQVQLSEPYSEIPDPDDLWLLMGRKDNWQLFIPHWLILLAVALPWLGLLFWRARRRRTAIKESEG